MKSLVTYAPQAIAELILRYSEVNVIGDLDVWFQENPLSARAVGEQGLEFLESDLDGEIVGELATEWKDNSPQVRVMSRLDTRFQGYDLDADGLLDLRTEEDGEDFLLDVFARLALEAVLEHFCCCFQADFVGVKLSNCCRIFGL
jgi:hypothetical protein